MDPKTGAIKKEYGIPTYTTAYDKSGKASISFKFKVKNVCERCMTSIYNSVLNGHMRPIHRALPCISCEEREVHQPYAQLCSLCSVIRKQCVKCLQSHDEYKNKENPLDVILDNSTKGKVAVLSVKLRRHPVRIVLKQWKRYLQQKITAEEIRQLVLADVDAMYIIENGPKIEK